MRNTMRRTLLSSAIVVLAQTVLITPLQAQTVTITERQEMLISKIAGSEKAGELTLKEATSLRSAAAKIVGKESRMKEKNGGKLSYANIYEIEKNLNSLSTNLQKKQLAKRVAH